MYKNSEIWLTIEEVCRLTNEIKELSDVSVKRESMYLPLL